MWVNYFSTISVENIKKRLIIPWLETVHFENGQQCVSVYAFTKQYLSVLDQAFCRFCLERPMNLEQNIQPPSIGSLQCPLDINPLPEHTKYDSALME